MSHMMSANAPKSLISSFPVAGRQSQCQSCATLQFIPHFSSQDVINTERRIKDGYNTGMSTPIMN
jgi:hypothetical protein